VPILYAPPRLPTPACGLPDLPYRTLPTHSGFRTHAAAFKTFCAGYHCGMTYPADNVALLVAWTHFCVRTLRATPAAHAHATPTKHQAGCLPALFRPATLHRYPPTPSTYSIAWKDGIASCGAVFRLPAVSLLPRRLPSAVRDPHRGILHHHARTCRRYTTTTLLVRCFRKFVLRER